MKTRRWITVGEMAWGVFVRRWNVGYANALRMTWRGRVGVFQPTDFLDWDTALWAVRKRLRMARLECVRVACAASPLPWCEVGEKGRVRLLALVERQQAHTRVSGLGFEV